MIETNSASAGVLGARASLSQDNYRFLQQYIQRESGIQVGDDKLYLLQSRLVPVAESEGLKSLDDLCGRLRIAPTFQLRRRVIEAMTTHETLFFRDPQIFEALRTQILPAVIKKQEAVRTLRIWSAACSSGQEPYTLAMILAEMGLPDWKIEIVGTDLSEQILDKARQGKYLQIEINRGLPAAMLVKYFQRSGLEWQVKEELRKRVQFRALDLRTPTGGMGPFDIVLCRNVLIYFDIPTRKQILAGIRRTMVPGGWLLLGTSETLFDIDPQLVRQTVGAAVAYQNPG